MSIVAGTVAEIHEEALHHSNFKVGDRVCALVGGGGYAGSTYLAYCIVAIILTP